jgi:hypothetical protein
MKDAFPHPGADVKENAFPHPGPPLNEVHIQGMETGGAELGVKSFPRSGFDVNEGRISPPRG